MAVVGIRKTAFNGLSAGRKAAFRYVAHKVGIVSAVEYTAPNGKVWLVACDTRFSLKDAAFLGALAAHMSDIPAGWTPPRKTYLDENGDPVDGGIDFKKLRQQARQFILARVVWPVDIPEDADRWRSVLSAQGAPVSLQFADGIPDGWTPVEVGVV